MSITPLLDMDHRFLLKQKLLQRQIIGPFFSGNNAVKKNYCSFFCKENETFVLPQQTNNNKKCNIIEDVNHCNNTIMEINQPSIKRLKRCNFSFKDTLLKCNDKDQNLSSQPNYCMKGS